MPRTKIQPRPSQRSAVTIDVAGKSLGRVATHVERILVGKDSVRYNPANPDAGGRDVQIKNLSAIRFTGRKLSQKLYHHHTGYVGHLKEEHMGTIFANDPLQVLQRTVRGMLPKNKWRDKLLKRIHAV